MPISLPSPVLIADEDPPVLEPGDVRRAYPAAIADRSDEEAPVLAGVIAGQTAMFVGYQDVVAQAAAQCDPARATGIYLEGHSEDRGVRRYVGENDDSLRPRMFYRNGAATPKAIKLAVDTILAQYTTTRCIVWETVLDRWFVFDGGGPCSSHASDGTDDAGGGVYPDRYYTERETAHPGGLMTFDAADGRYFVLRVPGLGGLNTSQLFAFDGTQDVVDNGPGFFVFDSSADVGAFVFDSTSVVLAIYDAIVAVVYPLVGHGVRWLMIVDSKLVP